MKRIKVIVSAVFGFLALLPAMVMAAAPNGNGTVPLTNLNDALDGINRLMGTVVPMLIGLAVIVFLWGVLKFIFNAGDPEKTKDGKMFMIYGIIGIVVMVSIWGLVAFVQGTFGISQSNNGAVKLDSNYLPTKINQ